MKKELIFAIAGIAVVGALIWAMIAFYPNLPKNPAPAPAANPQLPSNNPPPTGSDGSDNSAPDRNPPDNSNGSEEPAPSGDSSEDPAPIGNPSVILSTTEIAKHDQAGDCWVIVSQNVYSVTPFIPVHPGGADKIIAQCGKDATQAFSTRGGLGPHPAQALTTLTQYLLGPVGSTYTP